ncbi:Bcr/CflA family efflux MFS transporter [Curtobacterium sp. VKM Ac-1376]|uniref:Bcr/CflA family efflux MFS transporter n=1 Tax=Curtobacterium sp. VKM Ac-1376 TaxID=123312 RepID=UPI00188ADD92|nr:Bcr/CflA family efflux MFS transporter [Curtobacterium sp. VKM Ac-1376]MBF4616034.1 Bcr/CflA family efflux MFS transporter [Curtobacterium sp. VKM Ac-1376]
MQQQQPRGVSAGVVTAIGALAVLGPFAVDMFIPSLPDLASDLRVGAGTAQLTLTVYLIALGVAQLVAGPVADAFGRRRPLLIGLGAFVLGAVGAAIAPTLGVLLLGRVLQGIGAALALVIANASVRDRAAGAQAGRLFAVIMTIGGFGPVAAPAIGGLVDGVGGWRGVFVLMAVIGLLTAALAWSALGESLAVAERLPFRARAIGTAALTAVRSTSFIVPALALSTAFMFLFVYIGGASFVYQDVFGLEPAAFGIAFAATGLAVVVGASAAGWWMRTAGAGTVAAAGSSVMLAGVVLAGVLTGAGLELAGVMTGMAVAMLGLGAAEPALMTLVMGGGDHALGMRAAVLGALQYLLAAAATPIVGTLLGPDATPWLIAMTVTAALAPLVLGVAAITPRARRARRPAQ